MFFHVFALFRQECEIKCGLYPIEIMEIETFKITGRNLLNVFPVLRA